MQNMIAVDKVPAVTVQQPFADTVSVVWQVVDTTGAGDCFTGALAVGILEGMPYQEAMKFAGDVASVLQSVL